ncbi:oligopeptide ABC transporter [Vibrio astriarenae]|nr:oligopeptide ABC transporter [Vibrio sp. C7]
MYKNKITRALFLGAGLSLALAGCGEKPEEKQAAQPKATESEAPAFRSWYVVTVPKWLL